MYEANVLGTMRMIRALLPALVGSGDGLIVGVTSIAAFEAYRGGAGYMAAKHAQRAMLRGLRLELLGDPVRVTEVAPGMVETEFSLVRFGGDEDAAKRVYEGMEPLRAEDVAECIRWAIAQPARVNVDEIVVRRAAVRPNLRHGRVDRAHAGVVAVAPPRVPHAWPPHGPYSGPTHTSSVRHEPLLRIVLALYRGDVWAVMSPPFRTALVTPTAVQHPDAEQRRVDLG